LGLTLLRGSWFEGSDAATGRRVAVIDRVLIDRYWKGQDPIGKRVVRGNGAGAVTWAVVGVVATVKTRALDESSDKETIYVPMAQRPQPFQVFTVRTSGDPAMLAGAIREAVRSVDPAQPVFDVMTMTQRMDDAAQPRRAPAVLLSVFGALAMILAMLGVYGVLAFAVAQRTSEFGVRMALGATPADIAALVLKAGSLLVLAGVAIGMGGYLALNRLVATLLFSTPSMDPAMLVAAPLLLALVALAACLVPAMRATRIEPVNALRHD
jgi:ABC-type antimicrobial peptide transport system permease subunit